MFNPFCRCYGPRALAITACCNVGVGLWYMSSPCGSQIDWVEAGVVSPVVRKQNGCGCCWAVAIAASVEAVHSLETLESISLSVQELIDCDTKSDGCDGGYFTSSLWYIGDNGLSSDSSYPYMAQRSTSGCKREKTAAAARISGFQFVQPTEEDLERAVDKQPVVVSLQWPDIMRIYKGGIIDYKAVNNTNDDRHSVLIVGYGSNYRGVKYWRFKNSHGKNWGEGGFGRIRRHVADKRGVLGMFMESGVCPVLKT
uniref:Uncharacterized protein n=1 Tax=Avena sativa TaxID=4498 RepID=A0ACD5X2J5_AVESA